MRRRRRRDALRLQLVRVFDIAARQGRVLIFNKQQHTRTNPDLVVVAHVAARPRSRRLTRIY